MVGVKSFQVKEKKKKQVILLCILIFPDQISIFHSPCSEIYFKTFWPFFICIKIRQSTWKAKGTS